MACLEGFECNCDEQFFRTLISIYKSTSPLISASNKSQVDTIDEEVFKETQQEVSSDVTDSCHGDNDPEPENAPSDPDAPSELNENIISFAAMRSMSGSIGSWRSGTGSVSWSVVCDNFPQLHLLVGFLKVTAMVLHHVWRRFSMHAFKLCFKINISGLVGQKGGQKYVEKSFSI